MYAVREASFVQRHGHPCFGQTVQARNGQFWSVEVAELMLSSTAMARGALQVALAVSLDLIFQGLE